MKSMVLFQTRIKFKNTENTPWTLLHATFTTRVSGERKDSCSVCTHTTVFKLEYFPSAKL